MKARSYPFSISKKSPLFTSLAVKIMKINKLTITNLKRKAILLRNQILNFAILRMPRIKGLPN